MLGRVKAGGVLSFNSPLYPSLCPSLFCVRDSSGSIFFAWGLAWQKKIRADSPPPGRASQRRGAGVHAIIQKRVVKKRIYQKLFFGAPLIVVEAVFDSLLPFFGGELVPFGPFGIVCTPLFVFNGPNLGKFLLL